MPNDIMIKGLRRNRDSMKNYCWYYKINCTHPELMLNNKISCFREKALACGLKLLVDQILIRVK